MTWSNISSIGYSLWILINESAELMFSDKLLSSISVRGPWKPLYKCFSLFSVLSSETSSVSSSSTSTRSWISTSERRLYLIDTNYIKKIVQLRRSLSGKILIWKIWQLSYAAKFSNFSAVFRIGALQCGTPCILPIFLPITEDARLELNNTGDINNK